MTKFSGCTWNYFLAKNHTYSKHYNYSQTCNKTTDMLQDNLQCLLELWFKYFVKKNIVVRCEDKTTPL